MRARDLYARHDLRAFREERIDIHQPAFRDQQAARAPLPSSSSAATRSASTVFRVGASSGPCRSSQNRLILLWIMNRSSSSMVPLPERASRHTAPRGGRLHVTNYRRVIEGDYRIGTRLTRWGCWRYSDSRQTPGRQPVCRTISSVSPAANTRCKSPRPSATQPSVGAKSDRATCRNIADPRPRCTGASFQPSTPTRS